MATGVISSITRVLEGVICRFVVLKNVQHAVLV